MSSPAHPSQALPKRVMSPHLQVWRWHITMLASIIHRITGMASIAGLILIVVWLLALALGRETYTYFLTLAASPLGLLVWFFVSLAGFVHLTGGLRHLIWDLGLGFNLKSANALAGWSMFLGFVLNISFWAYLLASHRVVII